LLPPKTQFTFLLSSLLFYHPLILLCLFYYTGFCYVFFSEFLVSFEILRTSEKFLVYPRELAQYTTDKYLRTMNLHTGNQDLFVLLSAYTTNASSISYFVSVLCYTRYFTVIIKSWMIKSQQTLSKETKY